MVNIQTDDNIQNPSCCPGLQPREEKMNRVADKDESRKMLNKSKFGRQKMNLHARKPEFHNITKSLANVKYGLQRFAQKQIYE